MRRLFFATLAIPIIAIAQEPRSADLVNDPFFESYQPEVSVSGNVIVGVMTPAAAMAIATNSIVVNASDDDGARKVCLKAASRDGIYLSKNEYQLPDGAGGTILLPYESDLAEVVQAYSSGEIALTATAGSCDSGSSDYYLVSSAESDAGNEIVIFLNSFGATDVFYQFGTGQDASAVNPCEYISEGRRTTYDFYCEIAYDGNDASTDITIIRERFGREQPHVELKIIGAGQ